MQTTAITPLKHPQHPQTLASMHRLRARVFADRLGWDVDIADGEERDEFDGFDPTYILLLQDRDTVAGCARLLPASGPTMLERTFPQLLRARRLQAHEAAVESSRFCVDTSFARGRGGGSIHHATLSLFAAVIEWSMANGYTEIVTATDLRLERILNRAGWPMRRLGDPCIIGNTMAVAGSLPANRTSFERVCPTGYQTLFHPLATEALRTAA